MAFEIKNTLHAVETYVQNLGLFATVQIGEPKQAVGQGLHAAIYMLSVSVIRVYKDMLSENTDPQNNLESELASVVSKLMENLLSDTDLESSIMSIDAGGMDGGSMTATYGYLSLGGAMYRVVDINIPLIVNGSATLVGTGV